jgi:5-formyltetrahydrofolate cyclo-ligase
MTKQELRKLKQQERDSYDEIQQKEWSEQIAINLSQCFEFIECDVLHCYLPIKSEVSTDSIISMALGFGKTVVVPKVPSVNSDVLEHVLYQEGNNFEKDAYGISVPTNTALVSEDFLSTSRTLILAPMLGFNRTLHRLGYGKGFYDRLLALKGIAKFGLAFAFQYAEELIPESHDIPLDAIVTEQGIARKLPMY